MLMNALEPENIEDRVRLILSREISRKQMQALKNSGLKIPDEEMAIRWRDEFIRINNLEFLSVSAIEKANGNPLNCLWEEAGKRRIESKNLS